MYPYPRKAVRSSHSSALCTVFTMDQLSLISLLLFSFPTAISEKHLEHKIGVLATEAKQKLNAGDKKGKHQFTRSNDLTVIRKAVLKY